MDKRAFSLAEKSFALFRSGQMSSWFGIQTSLRVSKRSRCHLKLSGYLMLSLVNCKKVSAQTFFLVFSAVSFNFAQVSNMIEFL